MGLLDKFNSIEITADTRISDADRRFCQRQKKAYDHARTALKAMADYSSRFLDEQREIEGEDYGTFLGEFKPSQYIDTLRDSHKRFIHRLFVYFRSSYNVTISEGDAEEVLLPKKPDRSGWGSDRKEWEAYNQNLEDLELDYPEILDQIFIQLGGFSFQDKAIHELKEASRSAGFNNYNGKKTFEQKKAVISFSGYACSFDSWHEQWYHGEHQIKLADSTKNVIRALIYFEYGVIDAGYCPLNMLLGYEWTTSETELPVNMDKLKSVKCFKNGRVDFRFTSEAYAREFAEEYLER